MDRGIGVEDVALGLDALVLEALDHLGGGWVFARVGREGHQRAFAGRAGDRPVFLGDERIAAHEDGGHALVAHLAHDQSGLGMVAAEVQHIDMGLLELGDERRVVLLAGGVGLGQDLLLAGRVHRLPGLLGEAFAVGGLVVDDGDVLVGEMARQIFAGDAALLIIAAAYPIDVGAGTVVGEGGIGRGGRDLHHVRLGIDLRRRDR